MCGEWNVADWDTKEAVCEGRGTHLIMNAGDINLLKFARVLVKAPKILGTWCMESDTLYVSPEGSDDNKGGCFEAAGDHSARCEYGGR